MCCLPVCRRPVRPIAPGNPSLAALAARRAAQSPHQLRAQSAAQSHFGQVPHAEYGEGESDSPCSLSPRAALASTLSQMRSPQSRPLIPNLAPPHNVIRGGCLAPDSPTGSSSQGTAPSLQHMAESQSLLSHTTTTIRPPANQARGLGSPTFEFPRRSDVVTARLIGGRAVSAPRALRGPLAGRPPLPPAAAAVRALAHARSAPSSPPQVQQAAGAGSKGGWQAAVLAEATAAEEARVMMQVRGRWCTCQGMI